MSNDTLNFYMDLFKSEEEERAKENLKTIDFKNKNIDETEKQEDLNTIDFKKTY